MVNPTILPCCPNLRASCVLTIAMCEKRPPRKSAAYYLPHIKWLIVPPRGPNPCIYLLTPLSGVITNSKISYFYPIRESLGGESDIPYLLRVLSVNKGPAKAIFGISKFDLEHFDDI